MKSFVPLLAGIAAVLITGFTPNVTQPSPPNIISPSVKNAIRDNPPADGIPDEVTPNSADYVQNGGAYGPAGVFESRTYNEFDLSSQMKVDQATLVFIVYKYNTANLPDQTVTVLAYDGDGVIDLADWEAPSTLAGSTPPLSGIPEGGSFGEPDTVSIDVTQVFNQAVSSGRDFLGFSFRNMTTTIDPDGSGSSLLVVNNCRLELISHPTSVARMSWRALKERYR